MNQTHPSADAQVLDPMPPRHNLADTFQAEGDQASQLAGSVGEACK